MILGASFKNNLRHPLEIGRHKESSLSYLRELTSKLLPPGDVLPGLHIEKGNALSSLIYRETIVDVFKLVSSEEASFSVTPTQLNTLTLIVCKGAARTSWEDSALVSTGDSLTIFGDTTLHLWTRETLSLLLVILKGSNNGKSS
jgi:hypothetical protein